MNKYITLLIILLTSIGLSAQMEEEMAVKQTIEDFFAGFHAQDSIKIKATVSEGVVMQRVDEKEGGIGELRTDDFHKFLRGIVSIPKNRKFEEKITSYNIKVDGAMANAWTGFEFWLDGKISHCGVNSFQLYNDGTGWKIFYLVDVGRKEGCE